MKELDMQKATAPLDSPKRDNKITSERLKQLAISDKGFLFDPQTGQSFTINTTGRLVIEILKDSGSSEEAATDLAERCDQPYEHTLGCVEAFVMQLNRYL